MAEGGEHHEEVGWDVSAEVVQAIELIDQGALGASHNP